MFPLSAGVNLQWVTLQEYRMAYYISIYTVLIGAHDVKCSLKSSLEYEKKLLAQMQASIDANCITVTELERP